MTNQSGNLPGTTAPQAQLTRLKKRLTNLGAQLEKLGNKAEASKDANLIALVSRAKANATTACSLTDAVETIGSQTALDLLVAAKNDVNVNVALTAFEDVPEINNLKPQASAVAPVVLQDEADADEQEPQGCQPNRFSCCSPNPDKWFDEDGASNQNTGNDTGAGANTCEQPSYLMLTLPVGINNKTERVDEFLRLSDSLVATVQTQLGQAREALCHASGEDTCSLF